MPTSARKSSLGASRRAQQRAHLPFHADDLGRGKRTGLAVPTIEHKSDDFEPFDEILSHADTRTAWHGQNKRPGSSKKRKSVAPIYEDDEGGDMSMEFEDYGGPIVTNANSYFSNARHPSSPLAHRAGSSSRPVGRASHVDFDVVPSPRPRKSLVSSMRRSSIGLPLQPSDSPLDGDDVPFDDDALFNGDTDAEEPESPVRVSDHQLRTPRRGGRFNGVQDDDDENLHKPRSKGKAKATNDDHDEADVEEEIAQGLEDIDMRQEDEDDEVTPKTKPKEKNPRKKRALPEMPLSPEDTSGLRRGKRLRYEPLEWWRCEKVVYGRREPGKKTFVPTIKEIVRIPKDPAKPLGTAATHKSKRGTSARTKTEEPLAVFNPEEGWDDKTPTNGVVIDWFTGNEVSRRLAFPGRLVNHRPAANNDFFFTKVFGDGEYIAAGQLRIPPNKHKPSKMTKDNTYVFYVIEGAVTFKVHESSYVLCTGGMILVPRGNTYYIENVAERDARLFFAQARRVSAEEESPPEVLPALDREPTTTPQRPQHRSNSLGQAPVTARLSSERPAPSKRAASTKA